MTRGSPQELITVRKGEELDAERLGSALSGQLEGAEGLKLLNPAESMALLLARQQSSK